MPSPRFRLVLCSLVLACAAGRAQAAAAQLAAAAPAPEPGPAAADPLRGERWDAPFAVESSGRTEARVPRTVVVARPGSAAPRPEAPPPAAEKPSPAPPAPSAAADTEKTAAAPPARAPAPAAAPAARGASAPRTHRVESGQTFYGIAVRYGLSWSELQRANPGVDPERISIGQVLRIPAGTAAAKPASARRTHEVKPGDTLFGIARRYGVTVQQLREANRLEGERVLIGQTIIIPTGGR